MFRHTFLFTLLVLCAFSGWGQQLPRSEVFVFEMRRVTDSTYTFTRPQYLTAFNPAGYNNQPSFFSNNELYLTVQMPGDPQPDLFVLDLDKKTKARVTATPEGEFSPSRMPDFYNFSAVRQEIQGRDTVLRLWQFPADRLTNGKPVFKYLTGIGYYQWLSAYEVAVFLVENPNVLGIADTRTDEVYPVATNVGRCFRKLPNGNLAYVQKSTFGSWQILEKNTVRKEAPPTPIIETLAGSEDFTLLPDGTILMGQGSKLFKYNRFTDKSWVEIADFRYYNIRNITRLAVSNDLKIAVVAN